MSMWRAVSRHPAKVLSVAARGGGRQGDLGVRLVCVRAPAARRRPVHVHDKRCRSAHSRVIFAPLCGCIRTMFTDDARSEYNRA